MPTISSADLRASRSTIVQQHFDLSNSLINEKVYADMQTMAAAAYQGAVKVSTDHTNDAFRLSARQSL